MNKLFTKNLPWKIASLIFAFILWVFVINTQNPTQPQEISGVKIVITGLTELQDQGYELTNAKDILEQNFKVVVSGPRLEIDKLVREPNLITATLNLANYIDDLTQDSVSDNANYETKINLDGANVIIKDRRPQVTKVLIDKIASKEQKVTYDLAENITNNYTLLGDGKPIISPEKVKITGAKSDIDRISEAKVYIEANDFSEEQLVNMVPIKLYDADGEEITGLQLDNEVAEVKLPIGSQKTVPVKLNFKGKMPEGYVLTKVDASLSEVTIVGKAEAIESISKVDLEPIDKSTLSLTEPGLIKVKMILPDGVMTLEEDEVSVSLQVREESTLTYPILINELNLSVKGIEEGLSFEILTNSIDVELMGLSDNLINADKSDIKAVLDLTGYMEGEYTLPLTIIPPEHVKVKNSPISVKVSIKKIEESEPSASPNEEVENGVSLATPETPESDAVVGEN